MSHFVRKTVTVTLKKLTGVTQASRAAASNIWQLYFGSLYFDATDIMMSSGLQIYNSLLHT